MWYSSRMGMCITFWRFAWAYTILHAALMIEVPAKLAVINPSLTVSARAGSVVFNCEWNMGVLFPDVISSCSTPPYPSPRMENGSWVGGVSHCCRISARRD